MCERQAFIIDFIACKLKGNKSKSIIFARVVVDGEKNLQKGSGQIQ